MSALVIFDIDGVVKPYADPHDLVRDDKNTLFEGRTASGKYYIICLDVARWVKFLNDMRAVSGGDITFMWASAWEEDSNTVLQVLGIDEEWEWLPIVREDVGLGTWKMKSVLPTIEASSADKIVWLEDDLEADAFELAAQHGSMLAVRPDSDTGLTDEHMDEIIEFLSQ